MWAESCNNCTTRSRVCELTRLMNAMLEREARVCSLAITKEVRDTQQELMNGIYPATAGLLMR